MRWQQQEKSHYDERETAPHMISVAVQCIESEKGGIKQFQARFLDTLLLKQMKRS